MADQGEQYDQSWILYHILDRYIGSQEMVAVRRKGVIVDEHLFSFSKHARAKRITRFDAGSKGEGIEMEGSDIDFMFIQNEAIVTCPDRHSGVPLDRTKAVFMMRDCDSRPGYVNLELVNQGQIFDERFKSCLVPVGDALFVSSEIYSRLHTDTFVEEKKVAFEQHGPAITLTNAQSSYSVDIDHVFSFPSNTWPREANEWISRTRLHGWPGLDLIDQIVKSGCHLVPVGDKLSQDTFLQWRISFVCAERKLIHSLTHVQLLVYGLFKYFLKQISERFDQAISDADIISSYIIKTIIFHAVESTPDWLWQDKNIFFCFMFCFNVLIAWVNAGHCPNYFIKSNNMFLGKVHGENQRNLLRILTELHDMHWKCLSVGTAIKPSIGARIDSVRNGEWEFVLPSPAQSELECDLDVFCSSIAFANYSYSLPVALTLLSKSKSDIDEFQAYISTVLVMSYTAKAIFAEQYLARGNKEKYKYLRRCKTLLAPLSSVCTSPGLLTLATYYYQTGNYTKALELCRHMMSSFKIYIGDCTIFKGKNMYERLYCGREYTLLHKFREACAMPVKFRLTDLIFCPPKLQTQMMNLEGEAVLTIPPLPYAAFLSFLCLHDLGDTKNRDRALIHLRALKYDVEQGGCRHWIVNNLVGIYYETVGDTRRALREYRDSVGGQRVLQLFNPAEESIARVQHSQ